MKLKHTHLLFVLIILTLCVGTVNAMDTDYDNNKKISTVDSDNNIEKTVNKISNENKQIKKTKPTATKKNIVDVEADEVAVEYKKAQYLTIKLEDKNDKPLRNIKINAKVISKTKNASYSLTSNQYGVAKLNTKNLGIGTHKVLITSGNNNYQINKQTRIFVGNKESTTLKLNTVKTLNNLDKIRLVTRKDGGDTKVFVAYNGIPKYTQIVKAKFYYKNNLNGKIVTEVDLAEFDDGRWELPNDDYNSRKYTLTKVEVDYLSNKTAKTTSTVNKSQTPTTKVNPISVKKTVVDVEADEVAVEYKKAQYLTIKLEDKKDKPLRNIKINAKVISKTKNASYSLTSNQYGVAKLNTKNLGIGTHKVLITSGNNNYQINKQTRIFVGNKESTTLKLNTVKTLNNLDKIRLVTRKDGGDTKVFVAYNGIPKYTQIVKAKFYYKNNLNGKIVTEVDLAEFDDGRWELPNDDYNSRKYTLTKVEVDYLSNKTAKTTSTVNKSQTPTTKVNPISVKKTVVDVEADEVAVEYKKAQYLTIKLEDKKDKPLRNTKINVKVFTGNRSKTYTLTTNNYGIAKLNTKDLSLGNHKVSITSNSMKYIINKQSNIFVGKKSLVYMGVNSRKVFNNKDVIKIISKKINKNKNEVIVTYDGVPKFTKILKAKFYYKNKFNGKVITEMDSAEFDNGRWELPNEDYNPQFYTLTKVEVEYVASK